MVCFKERYREVEGGKTWRIHESERQSDDISQNLATFAALGNLGQNTRIYLSFVMIVFGGQFKASYYGIQLNVARFVTLNVMVMAAVLLAMF
jgi:hypothetical protein